MTNSKLHNSLNGEFTGRTVVVTGATSGIGKATATALALRGARLILICRDKKRGEETRREITELTGNESIEVLIANLGSQRSIRQVAAQINARYEKIHLLINNAGTVINPRRLTPDGIEETFAVNHLAPFLLTNLLLEKLRAGAPSRVVNLTSGLHPYGTINFADLNQQDGYKPFRAYNQAKLGNVLFTYELARRLEGSGVTTNAVHPGVVRTNLGRRDAAMPWYTTLLFRIIWGAFLIEPEDAAKVVLQAASDPTLAGAYVVKGKAVKSSRESYDRTVAQKLWDVSAQLTGLASPGVVRANKLRASLDPALT